MRLYLVRHGPSLLFKSSGMIHSASRRRGLIVLGCIVKSVVVVAPCLLAAVLPANGAEIGLQELQLATDRNEPVRAILAKPAGEDRRPAVIFNHGTGVRQDGYEGSLNRGGMNVGDFVRALVRENYVAIAPIRTILASEASFSRGKMTGTPEQWSEIIAFGIRAVAAARLHLAKRPDVDPERIAVMGFSEGGNVSLWSAIETPGYRAVVLLSPATISLSPVYRLGMASKKDQVAKIGAPVFLSTGTDDNRSILEATRKFLIPNLETTNPKFRSRTDYPGSHDWFWKVRDEYWMDVAAFLKEHLG